jgi:WD40 repeat protein
VAFSPDGKTLASASGEWSGGIGSGGLKLWDLATGRERAALDVGGNDVFSVTFAPDGRTLASGGRDEVVRMWDAASGRLVRALLGHGELVRSLAFHPDGRTIVSAGFDATIRFWDAATGSESRPAIHLNGGTANCVVISRDGRILAANTAEQSAEPAEPQLVPNAPLSPQSSPGVITLWDWASGKEARTLRGCQYGILGLAISPDGRLLASAGGLPGGEGEVKLWDVATGGLIAHLKGHKSWVECVVFSPDGKILVSAGGWGDGPGEIKLWDLKALPRRDSIESR